MAKFKIYNIQLLPTDDATEVGVKGYKKLFAELRDLNSKHLSAKTHLEYHYHVSGNIYVGPFDFNFPAGYVTGHFVRYRNTEKVTDLATGKMLFKATRGKGGVVTRRDVPFVFDAKRHFLAIDSSLDVRSENFISALLQLLSPIAEEHFPKYDLTVNLISKPNGLENVLKTAVSFKTVAIHLNGPNGDDALDVLGEMRETKMQKLILDVSAGSGRMLRLPDFVKRILRSVPGHGWSTVSYFVQEGEPGEQRERLQNYDSREQPQTFIVHRSSNDTNESDFFARVASRLEGVDIAASDLEEDDAPSPEASK
ncbi:DUF4747 family protein [Janthinobacterium sp. YR213]|uniref:DUF4747 family protein n=1 Tax=Janthinobacterium sp. YR213 TaxID=1881027 RepID=UPI00089182D3|nr:DUF4747 family protein [Janthinobacterium sp. YR213]SDH41024.1 protein of unknown function [Janthinobacterium sp. YR213]